MKHECKMIQTSSVSVNNTVLEELSQLMHNAAEE